MTERQPFSHDKVPRVDGKLLVSRLAYYSGLRPSPLEPKTTIEQSYETFKEDMDQSYPQLAERGLALAALLPWAQQGGEIQPKDMTPEMLLDGSNYMNLFTIGYGLVRDSYDRSGIAPPPDTPQDLWFDNGTPFTIEQFFDTLNLAQMDITEKYPALQLALQAFVKDRHIRHAHRSPRAVALASIAASEIHNGFAQMEAARAT